MKRILLAAFIGMILSTTANATCTITYACGSHATGTAPAQHTVASGKVFTPSANTCTRDGYVFSHYLAEPSKYTYSDAGVAHPGVEYTIPFIGSYTCSKSVTLTLTAQWVEQNPSKTTSKKYTDAQLATRQPAFAGDANGANKLMLFSGTTDGEILSRDIVTSLGTPNSTTGLYTNTDADSAATRGAINKGLNRKQDIINGTANYVSTYTGTAGTLSSKPVYDATSRQYSSAVVEASTLNTAVIDAVNSEMTQINENGEPDSNGTLWRINDVVTLLATSDASSTPNLMSLIGNVGGNGYTSNDSSGNSYDTDGMSNSIISGDPMAFAVDYGAKGMIKGHGRCSSQVGNNNDFQWTNPTISSTLPDASGQYCYCTLDGYTPLNGSMTALSALWVFEDDGSDAPGCAEYCAYNCARGLWYDNANALAFRATVFGSVQ